MEVRVLQPLSVGFNQPHERDAESRDHTITTGEYFTDVGPALLCSMTM